MAKRAAADGDETVWLAERAAAKAVEVGFKNLGF